ncbi:hypothetical protein ACVIHF_000516 [Bradyrhizobium sp. USDA 4506]
MEQLYSVKYGASNWEALSGLVKASDVVPSCN